MGPPQVVVEAPRAYKEPGAPKDTDTLALREAWARSSEARARAGLAPYTGAEVENLLRTRWGANPTPQAMADARAALTAWLDAETASISARGGVKTQVQSAEKQGFPVLAVVGGLLAVMFLMKGK